MAQCERLFPLPTKAFSLTAYAAPDGWRLLVRLADEQEALPRTLSDAYGPCSPDELLSTVGAILEGLALPETAD